MKLTLTAVLVIAYVSFRLSGGFSWLVALLIPALFAVYGVVASSSGGLDLLNDLPNAFRVALATSSAYLFYLRPGFLAVSASVGLFVGAILLNDEWQRRTLDSMRRGRRGGSVVLLGIDGSGKSTHASALEAWFLRRGYLTALVPFHRYLFLERLRPRRRGDSTTLGSRRGGNPFRPLFSVADNLLFDILNSFGRGLEGRVVIFDRYIWSTYVKYEALGYPARPLRWLYLLPRPTMAVVLDVPVQKSLGVIDSRADHIRYRAEVLAHERDAYLEIAKVHQLPVLDATEDFDSVEQKLESLCLRAFPEVKGAGV